MFAEWMTKLETVHRAETLAEREAVYRFRYKVYVEELHKKIAAADDDKRWIRDAEDENQENILLYTGSPDEITGTLRLDIWKPGKAPPHIHKRFSLSFFPEIETHTVCETARLMVARNLRGKMILPALSREAYRLLAERQIFLLFCYCAPGLVSSYRKLGYRPYPGDLISGEDGLRVPLVNLTPDIRYYREENSPMLSLVRDCYAHGKFAFDLKRYAILVDGGSPSDADVSGVWEQLETEMTSSEGEPSLFADLPPAGAKKLLAEAYTLDVRPDQVVTRADLVEQESFIIVEGTFEVVANDGRRLAVLTKGDVFGELAMFLSSGRRTASIRARTGGKVLMLRRKYLRELMKKDPELASQVLFNLGRVMAERLASMIEGRR